MLFSTFYFSGTGNTKWTVEQFNRIVSQHGNQAAAYSIDNFEQHPEIDYSKIIRESDFIGFANPIYGADNPFIMKKFIGFLTERMKAERIYAKPIYIINTFGYVNAYGPFEMKRLIGKNYKLVAYVNIKLCNNISTIKYKSEPISAQALNNRKKKAIKTLELLAGRLLHSKKYIRGIGLYLLPGMIIRKKSEKVVRSHYQSLSVQICSCNKCMLCVDKCPAHCIKYDGQKFLFSDQCTSCMRCYNFCPTSSIMIDGIYADPGEYFRYRGPIN